MSHKVVEFYCDIACPYNYIASCLLPSIASRNGATIEWKPVLLGGIYDLVKAPMGKAGSASDVEPPQKRLLSSQDLQRTVDRHGLEFSWHPQHPVRSLYGNGVSPPVVSWRGFHVLVLHVL